MVNPERQAGNCSNNVVETLALLLSGRIKREDLDENNRSVLGFYLSLIDDDPKFKNAVDARKNEMTWAAENGKRSPLYTDDELKKAKEHVKCKKRKIETGFQIELFKEESPVVESTNVYNHESIIDPERKLASLHRESAHPEWRDRYSPMVENIKYNNLKLRNIIGLPIVRGKDPHVGDRFYKFLVKRIVRYDAFRIFTEYDGLEHDEPTDVDARINQVKVLVSEVLDNNINLNEKYKKYHEFEKAYRKEEL